MITKTYKSNTNTNTNTNTTLPNASVVLKTKYEIVQLFNRLNDVITSNDNWTGV